ncbi:hypothetical protein mRhiFer1_009904 [Rhinolophus ferrumequinum]|uniref:Uncharacterized protein n=1 Tax=Rhinolophus ferrumequinum TaxID=59479 RepID=A0A7J7YJK9_RHIFE|nr:hypothetical protein mRhiFer1_009904 [Rhinolophus ferrumequinum]
MPVYLARAAWTQVRDSRACGRMSLLGLKAWCGAAPPQRGGWARRETPVPMEEQPLCPQAHADLSPSLPLSADTLPMHLAYLRLLTSETPHQWFSKGGPSTPCVAAPDSSFETNNLRSCLCPARQRLHMNMKV